MGITQLLKHLIADVDLWRGIDDAATGGAVQNQLITMLVADVLHGIVYLILNRSHQALAFLEQLAFLTEIFLLQVAGLLLLLHDRLFGLGLLSIGKEHSL